MPLHDELATTYEPAQVESDIYALWEQNRCFSARPDDRPPDKRFVLMIPLPNVTGALHLGHAINNTLQDMVTRYHRMMGYNSLWQPGTDHAGIATQAVVEKRIFQLEGKTRHDLGREELVRRIWEWKDQYEARILGQLRQMGGSCDWERTRFTLDDVCAKAVRHMFFKLFSDGLIFRGKRLVNWDTQLQTAVADDEVYHEKVKATLTHIRYPVKDSDEKLVIATTRPETMLGDTAVAVHPDDPRYKQLIGKTCVLPLMGREIPIIGDPVLVNMEFGTGVVKVTPAHDPNDYDCGLRNDLEMINMLTSDGRVNENGGPYAEMGHLDARKKIVQDLEDLGLIEKTEDYEHEVGHSDRSKTQIQPYLSDQWFVEMGDVDGGIKLANGSESPGLAQAAMDAVADGRVKVFPNRYAKSYLDWLGEKRDWCISRQLWWGHRIPIWTFEGELADDEIDLVQTKLAEEEARGLVAKKSFTDDVHPLAGCYCLAPGIEDSFVDFLEDYGFVRDADVLDTWFSSALWPFSTLGWPDKRTQEELGLDYYYPGSTLITSRDIITLWVARMVMAGLYCIGDVPFREVYIHTKILDGRGETMSKSKGNGVDPVNIISLYGADALRYTIAGMATETQDVRMPVEYLCPHCQDLTSQTSVVPHNKRPSDIARVKCKACKKEFATQWADDALQKELGVALDTSDKFELGRNFSNKLWNAARFSFMNIEGAPCEAVELSSLPAEDRWILAKLSSIIRGTNEQLRTYQFSPCVKDLREFFWDALCDWYIELTKSRMTGDGAGTTKQVLAFVMDQTLRLLHPVMPYITERLWQQLNTIVPERGLPGLAEPKMEPLLIQAEFPPAPGWPALDDDAVLEVFEDLQVATRGVRDLRAKCGVSPRESVDLTLIAPADRLEALNADAGILQRLANVKDLTVTTKAAKPKNAATLVLGNLQIFVHDISDDAKEAERLKKEIDATDNQIAASKKRLSNEKFVENAAPEVVQAARDRLSELEAKHAALAINLALLN